MVEILPIKILRDEDSPIFGPLNVILGKLSRNGFPVASGIVVSPPSLHLLSVLKHHDFGSREVFEQSLTLVKKDLEKTALPEILEKETKAHKKFFLASQGTPGSVESVKKLWIVLLNNWLEEIKQRLWNSGIYPGITENLEPQKVYFIDKVKASGKAYFSPEHEEVVVEITSGNLEPKDLKKLDEIVLAANKKLFIPHEYQWILDGSVKLFKVLPYTPKISTPGVSSFVTSELHPGGEVSKSTVKVFLDFSKGLVVDEADGIFIDSGQIFDLSQSQNSYEELIFKLVETATSFPDSPILVKLADKNEGMGKIRGSLKLIHQKSLLDPLCEAVLFARNKKGLKNIHLVIPFVRGVMELMQIKRELAVRKLLRKNNLQIWLEICTPENVINLEDYLITGIDGVILNLDELSAHFMGFDHREETVSGYKHEVAGLIKFLEDGIKLLHQAKIPFIAFGNQTLNPTVLEFLVEKGVYGVVVERYEVPSMSEILHQAEKRMILRVTS